MVKIRPEKNSGPTEFEPKTSAKLVQRSTNWANKPTGSWSLFWFYINRLSGGELSKWYGLF